MKPEPRYFSPITDAAFKLVFGNREHKEVLISFLNAVLHSSHLPITDLEILDPALHPETLEGAEAVVDVRAQLDSGEHVLVEMQLHGRADFFTRLLVNTCKFYGNPKKAGMNYKSVLPVVSLNILNFRMNNLPNVLSRYILYNPEDKIPYKIQQIEFVFIELGKFHKSVSELDNLFETWLYFLTSAKSIQETPPQMVNDSGLSSALKLANWHNLTPRDQEKVVAIEDLLNEQEEVFDFYYAKGKDEGEKAKAVTIAEKMIMEKYDIELIHRITGLDIETLQQIVSRLSNK